MWGLFAKHADGNAFDLAQHQSLFGLQTCIKNSWSRAAILILKRGTFDENENLTDCLKTNYISTSFFESAF